MEYLQQSPTYQSVQDQLTTLEKQVKDGKVHVYKFLKDRVETLQTNVTEKVETVKERVQTLQSNLYVVYDQSTQMLSFLMEVLLENQQKLREYLAKHYENVSVIVRDNWMRLDFNKDGHVSVEDIKHGAQELFEFLRNFDYLNAATEIKSSLY